MSFSLLLNALRNPQDRTDVYTDIHKWLSGAKRYAELHGDPIATLNTVTVSRFLFSTGRSIVLVQTPLPADAPVQPPLSLDQVVLSFFSTETPVSKTEKLASELQQDGWDVWTTDQPDGAFPRGSICLLLATRSWKTRGVTNKFFVIRSHVFKIGGPRPRPFTGWPE